MHVISNVTNRFCHTSVNSKVKNFAPEAKEATFSVVLPNSAYISGFVLEIDGKKYEAYVKEKEEAKSIYEEVGAVAFCIERFVNRLIFAISGCGQWLKCCSRCR